MNSIKKECTRLPHSKRFFFQRKTTKMSVPINKIEQISHHEEEQQERDEILRHIEYEDHTTSYYEEDTGNLVFDPPVGRQRYDFVFNILISAKWRKDIKTITDYGCGEYRLFSYIQSSLSLRNINFVDIDETVLGEKLSGVQYSDYHYLDRRFNPLKVTVFAGSISDPDERILNADAVVGIEIIEHLYPDTLEAVPYVIFNSVRPKIAIFTTPNADFNVVFPNFKKFRHDDHKFEWTREQFESWASNITLRFPEYLVLFFGVGKHPGNIESLGYCSQVALFVRKDILWTSCHVYPHRPHLKSDKKKQNKRVPRLCSHYSKLKPFGICTYFTKSKRFDFVEENDLKLYREIYSQECLYCDDDLRTDEEKLLEIMVRNMQYSVPSFEGIYNVPLYKILDTPKDGQLISEKEAGDILIHNGYQVTKRLIEHRSIMKWKQCVQVIVPRNTLFDESSSESEEIDGF